MVTNWNEIQICLQKLPADEKERIKEFFNNVAPDEDPDIGNHLFEFDADDFFQFTEVISDETKKKFTDAVLEVELMAKETFIEEEEDN